MSLLTTIKGWFVEPPPPPPPGLVCDRCMKPVVVLRKYADGRAECVDCATWPKRKR